MAGKTFSYLNGTEIIVEVQGIRVMECQTITFQEQINNQLIFGMGDYAAITNEPLQVTGLGGTLRVLRYTSWDAADKGKNLNTQSDGSYAKPSEIKNANDSMDVSANDQLRDGNSLAFATSFSPIQLLLEKTFDIKIMLRTGDKSTTQTLHTLKNCIMGGYSIGFNVGAVSTEDYTFICTSIE